MFDLSPYIDLPLAWGILIATAVLFYLVLDGFDLGVGILFPLAPSDECRSVMMNSISPFWDGNETWLVLGGGGLFAAFPLAYAIIMPAFYIPIIFMLLCLVMRGVAIEFRFKTDESKRYIWDYVFCFGSLGAAISQGLTLGGLMEGIKVIDRSFAGSAFDWFSSFSILTAISLSLGYSLLGACWGVMKTEGLTQNWSRKIASNLLFLLSFFMILTTIIMPIIDPEAIGIIIFTKCNIYYLIPIAVIIVALFFLIWWDLNISYGEIRPFLATILLFVFAYLGLGISFYPWIVPFHFDIWQAAASSSGLSLMFVGVVAFLPLILCYTGYHYYVFRGKATERYNY